MTDSAIDVELARLRDGPNRDDFFTAMTRLRALGSEAAAPLRKVVGSPDENPGFRTRALETLVHILGTDALELLLALTAEPELQVRWTAVTALGKLGDARALATLEALRVSDAAEWEPQPGLRLTIRLAAAEAISRIQTDSG